MVAIGTMFLYNSNTRLYNYNNQKIFIQIKVEAIIKGLVDGDGLDLYFWTDIPSGKFEELATIKTKKLSN